MTTLTTGLVIGKFYPPHRGHKFLIDSALEKVDRLTVVVCSSSEQTIPVELRAGWMCEIHPRAEVAILDQDLFDTNDPYAWAAETLRATGYIPQFLFTSESYGDEYARLLGAEHIMVDRQRVQVPVSARAIRENPFAYWEYLEPCVQAYFVDTKE